MDCDRKLLKMYNKIQKKISSLMKKKLVLSQCMDIKIKGPKENHMEIQ